MATTSLDKPGEGGSSTPTRTTGPTSPASRTLVVSPRNDDDDDDDDDSTDDEGRGGYSMSSKPRKSDTAVLSTEPPSSAGSGAVQARSPPLSPRPAAPPAAAMPAPPSQLNTNMNANTETDGPVAALHAMFPAMDRTIISEVLAAHGGNADAASFALLELNNPDTTTAQAVASDNVASHASAAAQLHADEEYARQLVAQMEREHMSAFGRPMDSAPRSSNTTTNNNNNNEQAVDYNRLNYVPRQRNRQGQPQQQHQNEQDYEHDGGAGGQGQGVAGAVANVQAGVQNWVQGQTLPDGRWKHQDELDQLSEQFNKFTDTGVKTFNSFLSKAKDKYAQTQQQRAMQQPGPSASGRSASPSNIGTGGGGVGGGFGRKTGQPGVGDGVRNIGGFKLPAINPPWQGGTTFKAGEKPMSPERDELRHRPLSPQSGSSVLKDYSQSPVSSSRASVGRRGSLDEDAVPIQINKALPPNATASPSGGMRTASTNAPPLSSSPATASPAFSTSPSAQAQGRSSFSSSSPAKVQMLPRQTISLFDQPDKDRNARSGSPAAAAGVAGGAAGLAAGGAASAQAGRGRDNDDGDSDSDVEYVRNPFNDDD